MKQILCALVMTALIGCASASKQSDSAFLKSPWDGQTPLGSIEDDLTREADTTHYKATATLETRALIEARTSQSSKRSLESEPQKSEKIKNAVQALTSGRTCFLVQLNTGIIEYGMFKHWTAKVKTSAGMLPAKFTNTKGSDSVPSAIGGGLRPFFNASHACTDSQVDLTKGFSLYMVLTESGLPPAELTWEAPTQ